LESDDTVPRYAILLHQMPSDSPRPTHWDLMLEDDGVLRTWALADAPENGAAICAQALPDHRIAYLTYEGPVSGNRGHVTRWDEGDFQWLERTTQSLRVSVAGRRLHGEIRLTRDDPMADDWQATYAETDKGTL
jgi:hypothetical protein